MQAGTEKASEMKKAGWREKVLNEMRLGIVRVWELPEKFWQN